MNGQAVRWGMAFAATALLSASLVLSAAKAPAPSVAVATIARRDPASVSDIERELILNKIREGDLLWAKSEAAGAKRAWQEARRLGEGLWPIHEGLADSLARAKQFDDALAEYKIAASLVPEKHAAIRAVIGAKRAATLAAAGRPLEAIQSYLDLNDPQAFGARIGNLALASDRSVAIGLIERHAEVYDARLFRLVAALQATAHREVDAAESLAKFAIRVAPWDEALNRQAIEGLRAARKFDEAVDVCRAWVRAAPESLRGYQAMGDLLWEADRRREALVAYSSIAEIRPGDAGVRRMLGEIYLRRGMPDEAMAQFERGLQSAPNDGELRARLIPVHLARLEKLKAEGKRDEARALRKKLGELNIQEAGLFDLKIVMTWDTMTDVDLDVVEPDGVRINHANRVSKVGGKYYDDNTKGVGPETYTLLKAQPGTWRVGAHLHSGAKATVKLVVILFEDTPKEERREETMVLEKSGETPTFVRDIVIP
ncbi:MAG: tetratricopeptide repeat protein [Planctomycetes bacterium]|nr:tetratricopeptide repeat protein [Planctomycetota bacterium]